MDWKSKMALKKNVEMSFGFTLMQEYVNVKKITSCLISCSLSELYI